MEDRRRREGEVRICAEQRGAGGAEAPGDPERLLPLPAAWPARPRTARPILAQEPARHVQRRLVRHRGSTPGNGRGALCATRRWRSANGPPRWRVPTGASFTWRRRPEGVESQGPSRARRCRTTPGRRAASRSSASRPRSTAGTARLQRRILRRQRTGAGDGVDAGGIRREAATRLGRDHCHACSAARRSPKVRGWSQRTSKDVYVGAVTLSAGRSPSNTSRAWIRPCGGATWRPAAPARCAPPTAAWSSAPMPAALLRPTSARPRSSRRPTCSCSTGSSTRTGSTLTDRPSLPRGERVASASGQPLTP